METENSYSDRLVTVTEPCYITLSVKTKKDKVSSDKQRSVSETNKVTLDPQWYQLVKQVIKQDRPEACFIHF